MEKEFVPYELAIRMKSLGYSEPYFGWYDHMRLKKEYSPLKNSGNQSYMRIEDCTAPLLSQAFRWFRDNHNIFHAINQTYGGKHIPYVNGEELDLDHELNEIEGYKWLYTSYEEAELACLTKLIEIVESK